MKQNIGVVNAFLRITCGFTMLAWIISKMVWRPYRESYILVAMLGAMKVAEGITRFCPVTALFKEYQRQQTNIEIESKEEEQPAAINPS